jgi:hypothetical protein
MQIEGHYVEVVPYCQVVFTWGGIGGVAPGQSTVEFLLEPSGTWTFVRLPTIICRLRALMRTIGNGRLAACRSSRLLLKGAIQAGFASAVRDDRGVRSRRGGIMRPASLLRSPPSAVRSGDRCAKRTKTGVPGNLGNFIEANSTDFFFGLGDLFYGRLPRPARKSGGSPRANKGRLAASHLASVTQRRCGGRASGPLGDGGRGVPRYGLKRAESGRSTIAFRMVGMRH